MATLLIAEYSEDEIYEVRGRIVPVTKGKPSANQAVTYTSTTASSEFAATTTMVRITASGAAAFLAFSDTGESDPVATTSSPIRLADGDWDFFMVKGGKVAAYDGTS